MCEGGGFTVLGLSGRDVTLGRARFLRGSSSGQVRQVHGRRVDVRHPELHLDRRIEPLDMTGGRRAAVFAPRRLTIAASLTRDMRIRLDREKLVLRRTARASR